MPMNRTHMRRQLYKGGGIADLYPRQKYGIGSWVKERARKLIPNELADVAVKAAPFVAPFNPAIAGMMRGIGRFDQRGSMSDAFKQGLTTTAFGAGARALGGASPMGGGLKGGFSSPIQQGGPISKMWGSIKPTPTKTVEGVKTAKGSPSILAKTTDPNQGFLNKVLYGEKGGEGFFGDKGLIGKGGSFDMKGSFGKGLPAVHAGGTLAALAIQKAMGDVGGRDPGESLAEFNKRRENTVSQYLDHYFRQGAKFRIAPENMDAAAAKFVRENTTEYRTGENQGGRIGQMYGTGPQGLPGIPRRAPDGMEFDMRMNGGFQGLGKKEGKDDVPAMLAKNEFVFTADAVRGAGGGDIELGAQKMYDTMKNLEKRMA